MIKSRLSAGFQCQIGIVHLVGTLRWRSVLKQQIQTSISTETVFTKAVIFPEQSPSPLSLNDGLVQSNISTLSDPQWLASLLGISQRAEFLG